jgi:transposase
MARPKQNIVVLTADELSSLQKTVRAHTAEARTVQRAKILLYSAAGMSDSSIAEKLDINRRSVYNCIAKFIAAGMEAALEDLARAGRPGTISGEEKTWIIDIACQKPVALGYPQELRAMPKLQKHARGSCEAAGYPGLKTIAASKIWATLNGAEIKPHKIRYYLEKRDPEFKEKMNEALVVYKQLELQCANNDNNGLVTVSYDEKPGIQAVANTAADLLPDREHGFIARDSEYIRLGTVSLLAGMDLRTGEIIPLASETHKSSDFICFLKLLDGKYTKDLKIRIILDNHSAHTSKETMGYLVFCNIHSL